MDNEEIVLLEVGREQCRLKAISYLAKIKERRTKDCLVIKGKPFTRHIVGLKIKGYRSFT